MLSLPNSILCCLWTILSLSFCSILQGQELREYSITCDPDEFAYIVNNPEDNIYIDCVFEYDGTVWDDARIQLRGEDAATYPKKSFKVNFDADNRFFGRDKINLKAEYNDPSFVREYLAYDLYHQTGLTASQTWFARLYVNGDYLGLYLDVEQVDECFLETAGLPTDASVYKAEQQGCLLTPTEDVEELWEKKTNEETGFYDLNNLISILNNSPEEAFPGELNRLFDVDLLVKAVAVNALLGNSSTYYQNYFLINDINQDGYWEYLPWDMNNTFIYNADSREPDYFRSGHEKLSSANTLIARCWEDSLIRDLIFDQIELLIETQFIEAYYADLTDTLSTMLYQAVAEDTLMQFSAADFLAAVDEIPGEVANRSAGIMERISNEPLPYDLGNAVLTPTGVYFNWNEAETSAGLPVDYHLEICDDSLFTGQVTRLEAGNQTQIMTDDITQGRQYWRVFAHASPDDSIRSISFFSTIDIPEDPFSGTVVTGVIETSTTWDPDGSPYSLPEGLTVAADAVLTIEPGVMIGIGYRRSLIVNGGLTAIGTADDTIRFVPLSPDSAWGSLIFDSTTTDNFMGFVSIYGGTNSPAGPVPDPGSTLQANETTLYVYDSHLSNGTHGAINGYHSDIHFERVNLDHFELDMIYSHYGSIIVRSCKLSFGSTSEALYDLIDLEWVSESSEISHSEFYFSGDDIIDVDDVHNIVFHNNYIIGAGDKGISIGEESDNLVVTNNIIKSCQVGFAIKSDCSSVLYNNVIALNDLGLDIVYQGSGGLISVWNTVISGNGESIDPDSHADLDVSYCQVDGAVPYPGEGNINADPLFVDIWNGNFYPQANSPLIDAGYGTGHPELDYLDSARVDILDIPNTGGGDIPYVDMGVYEYYNPTNRINPHSAVPSSYTILRNWPNPFNSATRIEFSIDHSKWAEVKIYNLLGQEVFTRSFENLTPGKYSLVWNGRDFNNVSVASGVYFCQLAMQGGSKVTKLVLMK